MSKNAVNKKEKKKKKKKKGLNSKSLLWWFVIVISLLFVLALLITGVITWLGFLFPASQESGAQMAPESQTTVSDEERGMLNSSVANDEDVDLESGLSGASTVAEVFRSAGALDYPGIESPDASRQIVFPDVPHGNRPALVAYEAPFEDGDYCDNTPCGMDVPQYYYRVMTAGEVTIPDLGVSCIATPTKGCLVIVINHFGRTAMYRGNTIDHGFTVAGRVWDMENPNDVTTAGQALLDHYVYRMSGVPDGANCGTIEACPTVEWHLVVIGNGAAQVHWRGLFHR